MKRRLELTDLFKIVCKKCNSDNVYLYVEECVECGSFINAECNNCKSKYHYHDFKLIEE